MHSALLLSLLSAAASSPPVWSRGDFTLLQANSDASLSLSVGASLSFFSPAPPLPPAAFSTGSSPSGPWGGFDFIAFTSPTLPAGAPLYEVRYHAAIDAFTFHFHVLAASPFPFFGAASNASASASLISYSESYMLPGERSTLAACAGAPPPAPQPRAAPSDDCPSLSGEWCCDWVSVTQTGNAITSTAAWGNGTGTVAGRQLNMTFSNVGAQSGALSADCGTIRWSPAGSTWTRAGAPARATDGPLFIFPAADSPTADSLAFAPFDNFTVLSAGCGLAGPALSPGFGALYKPAGTPPAAPLSLLLVGRPGLKRATVAWGAAMRRAYATARRRGVGSRALSYWVS